MSKKTLNKANLADLGVDRLADLLIEVSQGSADIKRRLRLELSYNLGTTELAHEVRKRLASLRKSKSFVSWRKRKALVRDLNTQVEMIVNKIAPGDAITAFDLLWQFIELAPSLYERADDRRGDIGEVFRSAIIHFADIAPSTDIDAETLANLVWRVVSGNGYGEWDGIISILAPTLGEEGLSYLKAHVERFADTPPFETEVEHEAIPCCVNYGARQIKAPSGSSALFKNACKQLQQRAGIPTPISDSIRQTIYATRSLLQRLLCSYLKIAEPRTLWCF